MSRFVIKAKYEVIYFDVVYDVSAIFDTKSDFEIYIKDTSNLRYILNISYYCSQHKMASFNFLVHRSCTFHFIKNIDRIAQEVIDNLIRMRKSRDTSKCF